MCEGNNWGSKDCVVGSGVGDSISIEGRKEVGEK